VIKNLVDALGTIADNVWAFMLFVGAGILAIVAHSTNDDKLYQFAGTVAMTGAALFHGKSDKKEGS
jgi:hypothetical protein